MSIFLSYEEQRQLFEVIPSKKMEQAIIFCTNFFASGIKNKFFVLVSL